GRLACDTTLGPFARHSRPGSTTRAPRSATRDPQGATRTPKSATRLPGSATRAPEAATRDPKAQHGLSAEAARDVVLRRLLRRGREDLRGLVDLDEFARLAHTLQVEEPGGVADARRLLHVVGDDDDRVVRLQLQHQVLDGLGG